MACFLATVMQRSNDAFLLVDVPLAWFSDTAFLNIIGYMMKVGSKKRDYCDLIGNSHVEQKSSTIKQTSILHRHG